MVMRRDDGTMEGNSFIVLIVVVSLAFGWILWPYYEAILWAIVLAILFQPLYRRLVASSGGRTSLAAVATVAMILLLVILPLTVLAALLVQEATTVYERFRAGALDPAAMFNRIADVLPGWITDVLQRFGLTDFGVVRERLANSVAKSSQFFATRALSVGQNAFEFVIGLFIMLYLLFFLLRDGTALVARLQAASPLRSDRMRTLLRKFSTVAQATVRGNIVIALIQGALGGVAFAFLGIHAPVLWGAVMAFLSLLPAVGAAVAWLPVALYLLLTGAIWQGVGLIAFGIVVIGLVDNLLRPVLVGKDIRMPDWLVLISTVGGLTVFGISGFVIGPVIAAMFVAVWDLYAETRAGASADR
jgi:predicted PurR-regulated permease PerM